MDKTLALWRLKVGSNLSLSLTPLLEYSALFARCACSCKNTKPSTACRTLTQVLIFSLFLFLKQAFHPLLSRRGARQRTCLDQQ